MEKERAAKLLNKKAPINAGGPGDILSQQRIEPVTSTFTAGHVVRSSQC